MLIRVIMSLLNIFRESQADQRSADQRVCARQNVFNFQNIVLPAMITPWNCCLFWFFSLTMWVKPTEVILTNALWYVRHGLKLCTKLYAFYLGSHMKFPFSNLRVQYIRLNRNWVVFLGCFEVSLYVASFLPGQRKEQIRILPFKDERDMETVGLHHFSLEHLIMLWTAR